MGATAAGCRTGPQTRPVTLVESLEPLGCEGRSGPCGAKGWEWADCRRWVPWLRTPEPELASLRSYAGDGQAQQGPAGSIWVLRLTPDAGTIKNGPRPDSATGMVSTGPRPTGVCNQIIVKRPASPTSG
jgi:hypothetical protein